MIYDEQRSGNERMRMRGVIHKHMGYRDS
jgi:hypothetical protein